MHSLPAAQLATAVSIQRCRSASVISIQKCNPFYSEMFSWSGPRRFACRHIYSNMRLFALRRVGELTSFKWIYSESIFQGDLEKDLFRVHLLGRHHYSVITSSLCSPPRGRPDPGVTRFINWNTRFCFVFLFFQ